MFILLKLSLTFSFAVLVHTVGNLDLHLHLNPFKADDNSDDDTVPDRTNEEPMCSLLSPQLSKCQCDCSKGDCPSLQKSLTSCGLVVFYGEQKDMKFCSDDTFYQARCMDQIDCAESIQCYINCCLQGKGADYMKRLLRGPQFEVLELCHPDADPKFERDFKARTECNNAVWPTVYRCLRDYDWKTSAAIKRDGVDLPRFCCAVAEISNCVYVASQVKGCSADQQLWFKEVSFKYFGYAASFLCGDELYKLDTPPCNCLPPVVRKGPPPPSLLHVHINLAGVLMNSSNEEC